MLIKFAPKCLNVSNHTLHLEGSPLLMTQSHVMSDSQYACNNTLLTLVRTGSFIDVLYQTIFITKFGKFDSYNPICPLEIPLIQVFHTHHNLILHEGVYSSSLIKLINTFLLKKRLQTKYIRYNM